MSNENETPEERWRRQLLECERAVAATAELYRGYRQCASSGLVSRQDAVKLNDVVLRVEGAVNPFDAVPVGAYSSYPSPTNITYLTESLVSAINAGMSRVLSVTLDMTTSRFLPFSGQNVRLFPAVVAQTTKNHQTVVYKNKVIDLILEIIVELLRDAVDEATKKNLESLRNSIVSARNTWLTKAAERLSDDSLWGDYYGRVVDEVSQASDPFRGWRGLYANCVRNAYKSLDDFEGTIAAITRDMADDASLHALGELGRQYSEDLKSIWSVTDNLSKPLGLDKDFNRNKDRDKSIEFFEKLRSAVNSALEQDHSTVAPSHVLTPMYLAGTMTTFGVHVGIEVVDKDISKLYLNAVQIATRVKFFAMKFAEKYRDLTKNILERDTDADVSESMKLAGNLLNDIAAAAGGAASQLQTATKLLSWYNKVLATEAWAMDAAEDDVRKLINRAKSLVGPKIHEALAEAGY